MTRRSKIWLVVAALFVVVNVGGAGFALAAGELLHAGGHALLAIPGAYLVWRLASRRRTSRSWSQDEGSLTGSKPDEVSDRLTNLEQAIDAIAIEAERIGEGQRFMTRIFAERGVPRSPDDGAAEAVQIKASDAAPKVRGD